MSEGNRPRKKPMNDEERAALAKKLDEDLDLFVENLASKKKVEGERKPFDFDEWCRELDQHPAFMTELRPNEQGEYSEAVQALQALKYEDSETEDRVERAEWHKEEGNKHFKYKKYRWATDCYTNGIKELCADRTVNSVLFANRAAAQVHLGNLRSATRDCVFARRFDPTNLKAIIRCAECLIKMGYGKQCIEWIDSSKVLLAKSPSNSLEGEADRRVEQLKRVDELRLQAVQSAIIEERDERKAKAVMAKEMQKKKRLLAAFAARNLHFKPTIHFDDASLFEWSQIEVRLPQTKAHEQVYLDEEDVLHWPLLIQYPEHGQTDFFTECSEMNTLEELLQPLFQNAAHWDRDHDFRQENVRLFVSLDSDENELNEVLLSDTLREILSIEHFVIVHGLPVVQMYTKRRVEEHFERLSSRIFQPK
ncbi:Tetratricopeptide repeat protein 4 [Toxocara canis]|uniref:Tetratricopeptide repeat protein 4 n=1 Tax=Toxocara canis TaxID=6265 RepID=A0A0B2VNV2_TOXCA|nr:Tetratricopeptide repeat protein 4 [Toxocara canis]